LFFEPGGVICDVGKGGGEFALVVVIFGVEGVSLHKL
jgi:hypothetical protein